MRYLITMLVALLAFHCQKDTDSLRSGETEEVPTALPFTLMPLEDLSAFQPADVNWSIAGGVLSDHTREQHLVTEAGTGILVNQNDDEHRDNLFTAWEHGDLELKLKVMIPKGSNSGIYFQGRYELQLLDSWRKEDPGYGDLGGIYQRWDDSQPEGQEGYEGHPPRINAAKAPGLWQEFHIVFRAPRFDAAGEKIENARFEKVVLNGVLIHEDVELSGPTRGPAFADEAPTGPLMIQGDHGPVAFRDISYKRYFEEGTLALNELRYQYFEIDGPITALPDFDTLALVKEGTTDSLVYETLSDRTQRVAYIFSGKLAVAKGGEYLFTVFSDDGSRLFIDDRLLIDNDGKHDYEPKSGLVELAAGEHDFRLTYFNNVWGEGLTVFYEGPELRRQPLVSRVRESDGNTTEPMTVQPGDSPEMIRSFVMHQGEKLTHAISVGDPSGLHYSVDLDRGSLLQFWRGDFADVTEMWYRRGQPQLLHPMEMAVSADAGLIAAVLDGTDTPYPVGPKGTLTFEAYDLDDADQPVFTYAVATGTVTDSYQPSPETGEIIRTIGTPEGGDKLYTRIAASDYVKAVGNGYYSVGGDYYIRLIDPEADPMIRSSGGGEEMLFPLFEAGSSVSYAILW